MLGSLKKFVADLAGQSESRRLEGGEDHRLAAAALLFHVVAVDGTISERERSALAAVVGRYFDLETADADALVAAAEEADKEAIDLYRFTSVVKNRTDERGREDIVRMMWELVYSDGALHEFEDNVVWRAAELLGVGAQARLRLKRAARGEAAP